MKRTVIRTNRGNLTVREDGTVAGLQRFIQRELRTGAQIYEGAGVSRMTFYRWRALPDFPKPFVRYPARGGVLELWSRTEVESWIAARGKLRAAPLLLDPERADSRRLDVVMRFPPAS